jgi:MYXO-CTERM domain-containing protein
VFTKTASLDIPRPNRKSTAWAVAAFAFGAALLRRRGKAADLRDEQ